GSPASAEYRFRTFPLAGRAPPNALDTRRTARYPSIERDDMPDRDLARAPPVSRSTRYTGEITMGARWRMAVFGLLLGVVICVLAGIAGQAALGLGLFAIMAIYSAIVLAFGERNATVAVPEQVSEERLPLFTLLAIATAGFIAILVAFFGFLWQTAQGQGGSQFAMLALAAGIGYPIGVLWVRLPRLGAG